MRKITTALFTIVFASSAFAQLSHPHFLSLNVGTNIPLGEYQDVDSLSSSGANTGLYYSFEAGAYFSKVMGIGVNVGAFSNSLDGSVSEQLKNEFSNNDGDFTVNSDQWNNGYIMIGPYFSFGSNKFIVDAKILGGIVNSEKPFVNVQSNTNDYQFQSSAVNNTSLGVNYGLHFRIQLKSKLALRINGEGMMSSQEFIEKIKEIDEMGNESNTEDTVEREISALNLGLGLVINL